MACHSIEQEEKVRAQIMCSANVQITWLFHKIFYSLKINTVIIFLKEDHLQLTYHSAFYAFRFLCDTVAL